MDKRNRLKYAKKKKRHSDMSRRLLMSVLSLVLATVTLVTAVYSWFATSFAEMRVINFSLDAGKQLRVNDGGESELSFADKDNRIIPASSVDGKNIFFPTDGSDFSTETSEMTFRSANVGDKNFNYIQIDFYLTAQDNYTALYFDADPEKTYIKVKDSGADNNTASVQRAAPLRAALWSSANINSGNKTIVLNPLSKTVTTAAVAAVDRASGEYLSNGSQIAYPFSEYSYNGGGKSVATLMKGEKTKFSFIVWLEGTDPKCTYSKIAAKDILINLAFTTSWDNTETIRFRDSTENKWVYNKIHTDEYNLELHYTGEKDGKRESSDYSMYTYPNSLGEYEWYCSFPGDMQNDISFILRPPVDSEDPTYEFAYSDQSHTASTLNRNHNRLYVADGPASADANCYGHWVAVGDSDGSNIDDGEYSGDDF